MKAIRLAAFLLALMTAMIGSLLTMNPGAGPGVVSCLLIGAACLASVAPFDAPTPRQRKWVALGAGAYALAAVSATALQLQVRETPDILAGLSLVSLAGSALFIWSFAKRNQRRLPPWHKYYDDRGKIRSPI